MHLFLLFLSIAHAKSPKPVDLHMKPVVSRMVGFNIDMNLLDNAEKSDCVGLQVSNTSFTKKDIDELLKDSFAQGYGKMLCSTFKNACTKCLPLTVNGRDK